VRASPPYLPGGSGITLRYALRSKGIPVGPGRWARAAGSLVAYAWDIHGAGSRWRHACLYRSASSTRKPATYGWPEHRHHILHRAAPAKRGDRVFYSNVRSAMARTKVPSIHHLQTAMTFRSDAQGCGPGLVHRPFPMAMPDRLAQVLIPVCAGKPRQARPSMIGPPIHRRPDIQENSIQCYLYEKEVGWCSRWGVIWPGTDPYRRAPTNLLVVTLPARVVRW